MSNLVIGIAGNAGVGKDTFYRLLKFKLEEEATDNLTVYRESFGDEVREELADFIWQYYGIAIFTASPEEKALTRQLLVAHGQIQRKKSDGRYWISILSSHLKNYQNSIICIPDIRFAEYDYDEIDWLKSQNGVLVYIDAHQNGLYKQPANTFEALNNPKLYEVADHHIKWPLVGNMRVDELLPYVTGFVNWLKERQRLPL